MHEEGADGTRVERFPRFNTASEEEIRSAAVADVYFHRTMEVLRARGLEDTPVHMEVAYKTSDEDDWFVVAGLDEVASQRAYTHPLRTLRSLCRTRDGHLRLPLPGFGGGHRGGAVQAGSG